MTDREATRRHAPRPPAPGRPGPEFAPLRHGPLDWAEVARLLAGRREVVALVDDNVLKAWGDALAEGARSVELPVEWQPIDAGERSHSFERALEVLDSRLRKAHPGRVAWLAIGGGVVADLAGVVASLTGYGAPWVQIPTSLTAQADPTRDGRVGLTWRGVPRVVEALRPPRAVLADPAFLATLPKRQHQSGLGVVLRKAASRDRALFRYVASREAQLAAREPEVLAYLVHHAAALTAGPAEGPLGPDGLRPGRLFAEVVQRVDRTKNYGEAAALGLVFAADLSVVNGFLDPAERDELVDTLKRFHLPTGTEKYLGVDREPLFDWGPAERGRVPVVVLERLGKAKSTRLHVNDLGTFVRGGR
jgi:3-dehydroquinate synthetase